MSNGLCNALLLHWVVIALPPHVSIIDVIVRAILMDKPEQRLQ